jgi:molybdopterin-containing oxidoreductase family membrane subunit
VSEPARPARRDRDELLYRPIDETGPGFWLTGALLLCVVLFGVYMYVRQLLYGLGVTGMNQPVTWGFYIINFVFFIGISHAGTLISAILRLNNAEWRRPSGAARSPAWPR